MTTLTGYGTAWDIRKARYWSTHPYRCAMCNRSGGDRWFRRPVVLVVHHLWYTTFGEETDLQLLGLCRRCHRLIHNRIDRHSRANGWMVGHTIVDRYAGNHYATFPRFTRRWVRWGRAFAWRDGLWFGRLPELDQ